MPRQIGDRYLLHGADVIDAEMVALFAHDHDAGHQVVDEAEAAGLFAGALDLEAQGALGLRRCSFFSRSANCGMTCSQPMSGP